MKILALDTCLDACSAAVWSDGRVLAAASEPMQRGHQERLAPMTAEVLGGAGLLPADLDRVAVTVGPGSFTGLRVGLAFAKGLALALDRPCVGIGTLEALALGAGTSFAASVIDARREHVYLQAFEAARPLMAPDILDLPTAAARLAELFRGGPAQLVGSGAPLLASVLPTAAIDAAATPDPGRIAALAATRPAGPPPRPLYLRTPDAKVPGQ
jgi:tRNA threonylcarbamoyladenosine biosynthesis protein TsaB